MTKENLKQQAASLRVVINFLDAESEQRNDLEEILKDLDEYILNIEKPKTLRQINEQLYSTLCDMLTTRHGHDENGQIEFNQNDLDSMEDMHAYIKIRYFLESPDGDREQEEYDEFVEAGSIQLGDEDAYEELTIRLHNTRPQIV